MNEKQRRKDNISAMKAMLQACGKKDFDTGLAWLTEDVYCDWPYRPVPDMPEAMVGRDTIHRFFSEGQADFAGLDYEILDIFELLDPDTVIAEYVSHSRHLATGIPYSNRYLGIFRFREGKIRYWREYINPQAIQAVFDALGERNTP